MKKLTLKEQQRRDLEDSMNYSLPIEEFFMKYPSLVNHRAMKKGKLEIVIAPIRLPCLSYNATKEHIALPNVRKCKKNQILYNNIAFLTQSFTHETIHALIHRMIGLKACIQWDLIDKGKVDFGYFISSF